MEERKRSLISPFETLILCLGIGIIAYVIYQNNGAKIIEKTEQVEIVQNPKVTTKYKPKPPKVLENRDKNIDQILATLAHQFSESSPATIEKKDSPKKIEKLALTTDELNFYKKINDRYKFDDRIKNTQDWFTVLKTANKTYHKVKSLFQNFNQANTAANGLALSEKGTTEPFSTQMEQMFDIKEEKLQGFAQKAEQKISDWAVFILTNQK